jgi:hypothetical protein
MVVGEVNYLWGSGCGGIRQEVLSKIMTHFIQDSS